MNQREKEYLYRMKDSKGYKILKDYMFNEMVNAISKNMPERDISFQAGIKHVFTFIDDEVKKLNFLEQYYPEDKAENEESNLLCLKMKKLSRKQILQLMILLVKILLTKK